MIFVLIILLLSIFLCVLGVRDLIKADRELKKIEGMIDKGKKINEKIKKHFFLLKIKRR